MLNTLMMQQQQQQQANGFSGRTNNAQEIKKLFQQSADKIASEVKQIRKMRDEIFNMNENFKKVVGDGSQLSPASRQRAPEQVSQMNQNLKNLVEVSKNHIQGLQNLEGLKNLQNFNVQVYTQAVNSLKKQIVQYQKQSENIERELKLRAAKLQKLNISPNFQEELLQPYEDYLTKKANSIDLHSIKQRVSQRLGPFDYGKFQTELCLISNEVKNQMNQFGIICKQFRVDVPEIQMDKKELKLLDLKLPSVLDEYKASKGIVFKSEETKAQGAANTISAKDKLKKQQILDLPPARNIQKKSNPQQLQQKAHSQAISKHQPIDLATKTKLTRTGDNQYKSVLETKIEREKQSVQNAHKSTKSKVKNQEDQDFQKYLDYRAKEQLALIYEQKKRKLQEMQKKLFKKCKEDDPDVKYELSVNLKGQTTQIKNKSKSHSNETNYNDKLFQEKPKKKEENIQEQYEYDEDFQQQGQKKQTEQNKSPKKSATTDQLKDKLKNLFSKQPPSSVQQHSNNHFPQQSSNHHQQPFIQQRHSQPHFNHSQSSQQIHQSIAQGFIGMINNTLAQVNSQLSNSIQKKRQNTLSKEKRPASSSSPNRRGIQIPKLEEFRAPPVFNMQIVQQQPIYRPSSEKSSKKIVAKNYDHLRINEQQGEDDDLEVSAMSFDD